MSTYEKLLPMGVPDWQMPFWESLKAHAATVQRCDQCGKYRYVPTEICSRCHSRAASWTPISGRGAIYTYTIVHRAPTPAFQPDVPYPIVHVSMEEGFRMIGTLRGVDHSDISIGLPVQIGYADVTPDWTLIAFEPA